MNLWKKEKGPMVFAVVALLAVLLAGCMLQTVDKMYSLPKRSEEFNELQLQINRVMTNVDYSAPISGDNQQAVQLADLDGDGEEEALLFTKGTDDRPLKIYIFDRQEDTYVNIATLESAGTAFDQVEYAQIDGSEGMELVVGRQVSDDVLRALSVYTFRGGQAELLCSAVYTRFLTTDLDVNGQRELLILRPGAESNGTAELYDYRDGAMERRGEVSLSGPVDGIRRVASGAMCEGVPAVFVASAYDEDRIITDVYALLDGKLTNAAQMGNESVGARTVRNDAVYAEDIDNDGLLELPLLLEMPSPEGAAPQSNRYLIQWYNLQKDGSRKDKLATYHCYADGWYVVLPEQWVENIAVLRADTQPGEIAYEFCGWNGSGCTPAIFTIYVFSGDGRQEAAAADGRFLLASNDEVVYAASIGTSARSMEVSETLLKGAFHLIRTAWKTGET